MNQKLTSFFKSKENQKTLAEAFYMLIFLILWGDNILPLLKITDAEPKIILAIAGFVFLSLLFIMTLLPYWLRKLTYFIPSLFIKNKVVSN